MPALPFPKYSLTNLYLFPTYATREDYREATGQEPPAWNPYRQPKCWCDPSARQNASRRVVYDRALATNPDTGAVLFDAKGRPQLDMLVLDREEAATVNIPPKGPGTTNTPGAEAPDVPVPLRPLERNEELFADFGGIIMVKNLDLYQQTEVGFNYRDRALLEAIARKLGAA